jgi:Glycoside hydrolase family 2 C-terminal domain 5
VATFEVAVVDRNGKRASDATLTVGFEVTGAGRIGNCDVSDGTPATAREITVYQGRAVAFVGSEAASGGLTVRATSPMGASEAVIAVERLADGYGVPGPSSQPSQAVDSSRFLDK